MLIFKPISFASGNIYFFIEQFRGYSLPGSLIEIPDFRTRTAAIMRRFLIRMAIDSRFFRISEGRTGFLVNITVYTCADDGSRIGSVDDGIGFYIGYVILDDFKWHGNLLHEAGVFIGSIS